MARFRAVGLGLAIVALGSVGVSVLSGGVAVAVAAQALRSGQAASGVGTLVNPGQLPAKRANRTPHQAPFLPPPGYQQAKARAKAQSLPPVAASSQPHVLSLKSHTAVNPGSAPPPSTQGRATGRPGRARTISGLGHLLLQENFVGNQFGDASSSFFAPPDTQVAAGLNEVVATTNDTMRVYSKGGGVLQTNDLNTFFGAAADQTSTDNKIVFDQGADRYYMANLLVNCCDASGNPTGSQIKLAVSQTSDPAGSWCVYSFGFLTDTSGHVLDQPKLGFSDDKITITENTDGGSAEKMDVTSKDNVLAGCGGLAGAGFSFTAFNVMPVISLSSVADQYAVFNDGGSTASILDITGNPGVNAVNFTQTDKTIATLITPPDATQPGFSEGGTAPIDAGDNRYATAVYQNGRIWAGAGDACNPGDGTHDCLRFDQFDTTNSFNVLDDREIDSSGQDLYFPAISLDSSGDIFFTYTVSSSSQFPTMQSGASTLPFGDSFAAFNNFAGDSTYQCTFCKNQDGSLRPLRWGDFSGAALDPNDNSTIWLAAEFGATSSLGQGSDGWSTGIAAETMDVPFVDTRSPASGPSSGGTLVDIHGGGFVNGGTGVSFGGVASPFVKVLSTDELLAQTPAMAPAHTGIFPQTGNGPGFDFTLGFDFFPVVSGVSPSFGPIPGGNAVHITGTGFTGASTVDFGSKPASFTVNNDNSITATAPAGSAGTVDVTVTTNGETSPSSFAAQYSYQPPRVSGLVPNAGSTAGQNWVTINGANFVNGATVKFGSASSGSVTFVSSTQLKTRAPAHASGVVHVTVAEAGATSAPSSNDLYAYGSPAVSSITPSAGPTAGGNTVTINGSNFVPAATVKFGTTASMLVTFVSPGQLKARAPAHAAGLVDLTVTTSAGTSTAVAADRYTFDALPTVTNVAPDAWTTAGGNTVTITGTHFVTGATVKFGTIAAASPSVVSSTRSRSMRRRTQPGWCK